MLIEAQPLDFTVIGAPRSGAAWLASMLRDHPNIAVATRSGPGFFADRHPFRPWRSYVEDGRALRRLFSAAPPDALLGEIAPLTYFDPLSASRQSNLCPDSQVFVLLRNPVDMLHSLFRLGRRLGWWAGSFEDVLSSQPSLLDLAFYDRLLTAYRDWFPANQLHVLLTEQMFAAEYETLDALLQVLEVESELLPSLPEPDETVPLLNAGSGPAGYAPLIRRCIGSAGRRLAGFGTANRPGRPSDRIPSMDAVATPGPGVAADTRLYLLDELDADISRLESSFGIDLAHWRSNQPSTFAKLPDNVVRLPVNNRAMAPA